MAQNYSILSFVAGVSLGLLTECVGFTQKTIHFWEKLEN